MEAALTGGNTSPAALRHDCELRRLSRVQSIFGGTTEIQKEIIARGLGL
jgi:alkylation response protein AidB-like acyl-CoA dehydrogenase